VSDDEKKKANPKKKKRKKQNKKEFVHLLLSCRIVSLLRRDNTIRRLTRSPQRAPLCPQTYIPLSLYIYKSMRQKEKKEKEKKKEDDDDDDEEKTNRFSKRSVCIELADQKRNAVGR
jgi:hypothetical protein